MDRMIIEIYLAYANQDYECTVGLPRGICLLSAMENRTKRYAAGYHCLSHYYFLMVSACKFIKKYSTSPNI